MAGVPSLIHEREWSLVQTVQVYLTKEHRLLNYSNWREGEACP